MYGVNIPTMAVITVTGGSGSKTLNLEGKILGIGILAPSAAAVFDLEILDIDGFGVAHIDDGVGNMTIPYNMRFFGQHTIYLTNATDGEYKIKVWFE
jgi:hypothetical protein